MGKWIRCAKRSDSNCVLFHCHLSSAFFGLLMIVMSEYRPNVPEF